MRGIRQGVLSVLAALLILAPTVSFAADLNDLLNQRDQLNKDLDKYQSAAGNKEKEAKTLSNQISSLESDINATETKIGDTNQRIETTSAVIGQLSSDIDKKNSELTVLKQKLNSAIVEIYRSSTRDDWELLLGSASLSESMNQMKYTETVESQVNLIHGQVTTAKNDLEKQKSDQEAKKAELDQLKSQQEGYKRSAESQMQYKDKLLGMTVEQKQSYEEMAQKLQTEITHVSSAIYAERQRRLSGGRESLGGGSSGYPYSAIDEPDAWGFLTRECTSYAAWYWNNVLGKKWTNTQPGRGSARYWDEIAGTLGYSVSSTPRVGAIISFKGPLFAGDQWGHVAIVESVNSNGTIDLSEMNWIQYSYSYRKNVTPGDYGSYVYIY